MACRQAAFIKNCSRCAECPADQLEGLGNGSVLVDCRPKWSVVRSSMVPGRFNIMLRLPTHGFSSNRMLHTKLRKAGHPVTQ